MLKIKSYRIRYSFIDIEWVGCRLAILIRFHYLLLSVFDMATPVQSIKTLAMA